MLPDVNELVEALKKAALDAVESTKPVYAYFGEVISVSPLKINVEQKMILGEAQLILSRNVTDYKTSITVNWETENYTMKDTGKVSGETESDGEPEHTHKFEIVNESSDTHNHKITGKKEVTVHNSLAVGDEVILLRQQEGQKFIILDRVGK